jgi:anti-sigma regulatory factor (Ser/Thr protein kinase)/serine/threonine protein phosphatase PrpC
MLQQLEVLLESVAVSNETDAYGAADSASHYAGRLGFEKTACLEVKIAVSEIAVNAVRYAGGGTVEIFSANDGKVLKLCVHDSGGGIADMKQAWEDGFTTSQNSMGVGLSVARRSMDEISIDSELGRGTRIVLKKFLPVPLEKAQYGVVSLPDERYDRNGDAYLIKEYDGDKVLLSVIDGLGQGESAEYIANVVKKKIEQCYRMELANIMLECDRAIRAEDLNSGVALSLVLLTPQEVHIVAIGDTYTKVFMKAEIDILSQKGLVGNYVLPQVKVKIIPVDGPYTIIMCTDGIVDHFSCEDIVQDLTAQQIADFIFNTYHRSYGDATVLVAKINDL